jgi:hypothetical protein
VAGLGQSTSLCPRSCLSAIRLVLCPKEPVMA